MKRRHILRTVRSDDPMSNLRVGFREILPWDFSRSDSSIRCHRHLQNQYRCSTPSYTCSTVEWGVPVRRRVCLSIVESLSPPKASTVDDHSMSSSVAYFFVRAILDVDIVDGQDLITFLKGCSVGWCVQGHAGDDNRRILIASALEHSSIEILLREMICVGYFNIESISSICIWLKFDQDGIDRFLRDDIIDERRATVILIGEIKAINEETAIHSSTVSFFANRMRAAATSPTCFDSHFFWVMWHFSVCIHLLQSEHCSFLMNERAAEAV